jgi:RNase P subunit RPR2
MPGNEGLICCKCNVPLVPSKTSFSYLKHNFSEDMPKCPKCGQVYISETMVRDRMIPVEQMLEDK